MNRDRENKNRQPNPISTASFVSKWLFWWLKPMFKIGLSRTIEDGDVYAVPNSMQCDQNTEEYAKLWQLELKKDNPSIFRVMFKLNLFKVLGFSLWCAIIDTIARVIQPICLGRFVTYFAQFGSTEITSTDAYWYATGIVLSTAVILITFNRAVWYATENFYQLRAGCSGLIYQKLLRISKSSESGQNGQIINLLSNDLWKFDKSMLLVFLAIRPPMELIAYSVVIYMEIGVSAVIGMVFLVVFAPLQAYISRKWGQLRMRNNKRTDVRLKLMSEILLGIQVIKMYAWEKSFAKLVNAIRMTETNVIRSIGYIQATLTALKIISKISVFLCFASYVYFGNAITARKVFIISTYFNVLSQSLLTDWPVSLTYIAEAWISKKRLQEFLLKPETKIQKILFEQKRRRRICEGFENASFTIGFSKKPDVDSLEDKTGLILHPRGTIKEMMCRRVYNIDALGKYVRLEKAKAVWESSESEQMTGVYDLNLHIDAGLCAIVGQVGSGKSTLLNVILGELDLDGGTITINGSISYASQEPWIFEGTVRSNIVFVEDFDDHRYNKVVEVCALERDFQLLPQGDATIVGERGSTLSGGQRARVNLARAIYKQSDIYLLDDPLSAVDTHVGKHIFGKCIKEFLADKICMLVTHQLQYLKDEQHVVLLNNGRIEAEGPFKTLEKFNKEILTHAQDVQKDEKRTDQNLSGQSQKKIRKDSSSFLGDIQNEENNPDDRSETKANGSVTFKTFKSFFQAVSNYFFVVTVSILFIVSQFAWSGLDFFLSEWVDWEEKVANIISSEHSIEMTNSTQPFDSVENNRRIFLIIYICMIIFATISMVIRSLSFFRMCVRVSINLHDMLFRGVTQAKMIFFNKNPSGRILNRFAGDINSVDCMLPKTMFDVLDFALNYIAIIMITAIVNPWSLIPASIMTLLLYLMRIIFIGSGRCLKRIEALSRSPVYSHVNATLQGATTIRAFNASKKMESEFYHLQDQNTSSGFLFAGASRWFAFWLSVVCFLFIAFITYSFLLLENSMEIHSGKVGLVILSSINLIDACQWGIRQSAELENQMISVERIIEYAELPSEPAFESDEKNAPPRDWPSHGNIEFKALSLRYAEQSARVLRELTFHINAKDKIGIVGRTGAGKSSIIQSLFRLAQNEGQILIDGVDIGVIGLHDLRKKISIIPQEAVLFSGSLRFNLDPFGERSDDDLWNSLEQVELKSVVSARPDGIDCKVLDGGSNFSAGQRQLVCLARAILRNNKILILDEATANVDLETDKLIQETIRSRFADCTVITIAHRLNTVMDSDKVLVVDAGKFVEFDHPFELIKKDGAFKRLLDQTGTSAANALVLVAKKNYEKSRVNQ